VYACGGAADKAGSSAAVAAKAGSKTVTSQSKAVSRKVIQKAKQKVKAPASHHSATQTKATPKDKVSQKNKPQVNVSNVNFNVLKERLKNTDAIGFFTKLAIRNDIVDLMDNIKRYRKHAMLKAKMTEIRRSFDGLLLKIIALLEGDPKLSRDLYVGRETIWESLLEVKT